VLKTPGGNWRAIRARSLIPSLLLSFLTFLLYVRSHAGAMGGIIANLMPGMEPRK